MFIEAESLLNLFAKILSLETHIFSNRYVHGYAESKCVAFYRLVAINTTSTKTAFLD